MGHYFTEYIQPSVMLLTIFLYCIVLFVLLKGRKTAFSSSFYSLFASTGIADVVYLLVQVFMVDSPSLFYAQEWLKLADQLVRKFCVVPFQSKNSIVFCLSCILISG
jgi:hypothetical protein